MSYDALEEMIRETQDFGRLLKETKGSKVLDEFSEWLGTYAGMYPEKMQHKSKISLMWDSWKAARDSVDPADYVADL
jgi:hypothetical protein